MWQLENETPFAVERTWARDRNGEDVWIVVVRCTFDIRPDGTTAIAAEQVPVVRHAEYRGDPGKSSVLYESDLILTKTATDIIVIGHAYAPDGHPTTQVDVAFRIGPVQKHLRVTGDRVWDGEAPSTPRPFVTMPLVYERAFGGADRAHPDQEWDWRNPIGTGFLVTADALDGTPLPNIEYPGELLSAWDQRPRPAGFGPIDRHWQPRLGLGGTYDDAWRRARQPLVPVDFDDRFFQCAPPDQQVPGFLRGGELAVLHRLTADGELRFSLPTIFLGFQTRFSDGSRLFHKHRRLHSVIVEPDRSRLSLVWQTALPCHLMMHKLQRTIVNVRRQVDAIAASDGEP